MGILVMMASLFMSIFPVPVSGVLSYALSDPIDEAAATAAASYAATHNASLAFKGAAYGLVATNGSSITLEWTAINSTEFSDKLATLTYVWHSGVWCCNRSTPFSPIASSSINPLLLSYSLTVPGSFLPGSRWLLTLNISSKPQVVPARILLHVSEVNKRTLSPSVIVSGNPGVGTGLDSVAFGGVGIDAKGSQGTIFGGGTITASTVAYGFKPYEQIEFYFFRSIAGETCSLASNYSLCLPRQTCTSTGPPTFLPTIKWPLGLNIATTKRFLYKMTLGVVNTTLDSPANGEVITVTYTLPEVDDDLFTPHMFYMVGAMWYNVTTVEVNARPTPYTPDGLPENATSRSPCFAVYGTEEGTFPSILNVQVPPVVVGSPTTSVKVTWDVASSLLPSTPAFGAARVVLSLYEAGKTQRVGVIDWNVPNTGVYWWAATDALVNLISENIAGPRQYFLMINTTRDSFVSVYGKSKTFAIADGGQNVDIIVNSSRTTKELFTFPNATRAGVAVFPHFFNFGDGLQISFSIFARVDKLWGATSFVPNAFSIDVICSMLPDFSDAAKLDSFTANPISVNTFGDTRQSASIFRNYSIPGPNDAMIWSDSSVIPPAFMNERSGLPDNGTCWLSVYASRNRFRRALSSPFAIQSMSAAARIPPSFSVTFFTPRSNTTFITASGKFINVTYMIEAAAGSLPPQLTHLTVSLYRFTGQLGEPITISNIQKVNLKYQVWRNELGDIDTICLVRPCGYDEPVLTNPSAAIRFTRFIQVPSSLVSPGNNYFVVVSSPVPSYRFLRVNGPLFDVATHRLALSDDQHFCNNTLFHAAAATRPSFNIECNLTSTLPNNNAADNQLDLYLLYANRGSSWTPEAELAAGILPPVAAVLSRGNPGKGYLRSGNIFWSATNFTYGVNFTVPSNIELNQVYVFLVHNARYNVYAWSYFYVGNFDDNDANLGRLEIATPIADQITRAGNVLLVQWTSHNVMFDTSILVKLVDINGGVLAVLSPDASNVEATQRWLIPASFCGGARSYVCGPNETASTTVKIRVESAKNDAVFGNSKPFYIYPPLKFVYIAVASPVFKSVWYNGTQSLVMWTNVGLPVTSKCSVSLMRHRYFLAAGDELVATLSPSGGILCSAGRLTVTPPYNTVVGFPVYVVIAQLNAAGVWDADSYWGRSDLFTLSGARPTSILQLVQAACEMAQLGGLPSALCKKDCAVCRGGAWVSAVTVSLDFEFPYWPFNSYDLVILKRALGAIRSTNLNLCWPGNTDPATVANRPTAEKIFISTSAVPLYETIAPLLPPGVTVRPFLRLEYGGLGPAHAACSMKYAQSNIPITAVTGYAVSADRASQFALIIQQSLMRMASLGPASIAVSVDSITSADATKSASGEGVGAAGLTAGTLPQVSLLDQVTGNKVALPDAAAPEDMRRRRRLLPSSQMEVNNEFAEIAPTITSAPPTSRLEAAAVEALRQAAKNKRIASVTRSGQVAESYERARRLQEFTPLPTGPPVVTLIRMSARIALTSSDLLREVNNIALLDGLIEVENRSSLFDFGSLGQAAVVFGVARSYPGGLGSAVSSWDNINSLLTDVYSVDFSSADTGQPTAATGSLQSILSRTAWTDGTANFQISLYAFRRRPGPPRPLSPGEIAAIVISILFIIWFIRFLYFDYIHRVYFFPAPLVELPPVAGEPFDPTLKTIEQALAMHHETGHVIPDETAVPKDDRYAVRSITKAVMASASPIPHDVGLRVLGGPASSPARVHPHPDSVRLAKQRDREAQAAAAEALRELDIT